MSTIIVILLAIIAYYIYRIYRQKEEEKEAIEDEKRDVKREQARKERFKNYPHLYGKLEGNWLDVFAKYSEDDIPLLKMSFLLMLGESTKIDYSEGSMKWDALWNVTEELLEHLEKFHEGSTAEHEIAIATYWQIAATKVGELVKEDPEIEGAKLEVEPYTNIENIASLFPQKANHPVKEITFFDEKGNFPRESEGSEHINQKLKAQGV